jgi:hypothetical protein
MTGKPDIMPLFLEIAATSPRMRRAITEACNCLLEGMGPSFTELRHYLNEINDTGDTGSPDFADLWEGTGQPGTPAGVIHFLSTDLPEGRGALNDIIRMGLGKRLTFVQDNADTIMEKENLDDGARFFLRSAEESRDNDIETITRILDTVPNCAIAVLSETMGDWYNSDERNLGIPDEPDPGRVVNGWLVHNSDNAESIYNEGFIVGNPIGYLAYGKRGETEDDKYGFAYRIEDAPAPGENTTLPGLKYTFNGAGSSIVFMGTGNVVDHYGDREKQVIFDINEPTGCFLVKFDGQASPLGTSYCEPYWSVYGKNPDRPLVTGKTYRECLNWIQENGWQYRNQIKEWYRT